MKRQSQPQAFFILGIAGLFLAGFFLLVTFGAAVYRQAVEGQAQNNRTRALLSYLTTCVRANDHPGALEVHSGELYDIDSKVLLVRDPDSDYVQRIYQWQGQLLEDYGKIDDPLRPEDAQVLGETEIFQIDWQDGVQVITTDEGQVFLRLRSGPGMRCGNEK